MLTARGEYEAWVEALRAEYRRIAEEAYPEA